MITYTMNQARCLSKSGDETLYRREIGASAVQVVLPRYLDGVDVCTMQIRLCFAIGTVGDFAVLDTADAMDETSVTYSYRIGESLTQQAGQWRVWVEFWSPKDAMGDNVQRCIKSAPSTLEIAPHSHSQELVTPPQLTVFSQLQATLRAQMAEAKETVTEAKETVKDAASDAAASAVSANRFSEQAQAHSTDAAASADAARAAKEAALTPQNVHLRYAAQSNGTDFTDTQVAGQDYLGIAVNHGEAPTDEKEYVWVRLGALDALRQGEAEIRLANGARIVAGTDGSFVFQPAEADSNSAHHSYTFTAGVLNHNGGYAAAMFGYQNRTTASQQLVSGQGNTLPPSRNMAVVGQFCENNMTKPDGEAWNTGDAQPLFAVGNGKSASARSNAFAVYSDGEVVLKKGSSRIQLCHTLLQQEALLSGLMASCGNAAYTTVSRRLGMDGLAVPQNALRYAQISRIGVWAAPADGHLTLCKDYHFYDEGDSEHAATTIPLPSWMYTLPDFGAGLGADECNVVDLLTKTYTQNYAVYTFTGEESISHALNTAANCYRAYNLFDYDNSEGLEEIAIWNKGTVVSDYPTSAQEGSFSIGLKCDGSYLFGNEVLFYSTSLDADGIMAELKRAYQAGYPYRIVYRKKTPTVTALTDETLHRAWYIELPIGRTLFFRSGMGGIIYQHGYAELQYQVHNEEETV